jgi:hypothetical protein
MCPVCINSYIRTVAVIAGSTGGVAAVVRQILTKSKGESRWLVIKSFLKSNGLRRGRNI